MTTRKSKESNIRDNWFKDHVARIQSFSDGNLLRILWKKPGTSCFAVMYIIDCLSGVVSVYGDLGEAVYVWYPPINIEFLGNLDLDYFASKCQASSCGKKGMAWESEVAIDYLHQFVKNNKEDICYEDIWNDGEISHILKDKDKELYSFTQGEEEHDYKFWRELTQEQKDRYILLFNEYLSSVVVSDLRDNDWKKEYLNNIAKNEELLEEALSNCENEFEWNSWVGGEDAYELFGSEFYEYCNIGKEISLRTQSHMIGLRMILEGLKSGKYSYEVK